MDFMPAQSDCLSWLPTISTEAAQQAHIGTVIYLSRWQWVQRVLGRH